METARQTTRRHVAATMQLIASEVDATPEELAEMTGPEFLARREARRSSDTIRCGPPVFEDEAPTERMRRAVGGGR